MIHMAVTMTYDIDLEGDELTAFLDKHACPPAKGEQTPEDRFMELWTPTPDGEQELRDMAVSEDEDVSYDMS